MKRINIILTGLALALLQTGCTDFNDQFEGLDDMVAPKNVVSYDYELTADDYSAISKSALADAQTAEDSAKAKSIANNKYFTETVSAADYVPYLLESMYKYSDMGSSAMVTYSFGEDKPAYFSELRSINILNAADYQLAWGSEVEYVNALTPTVSASSKMSDILTAKFPNADNGEYKFVEYNYSEVDAEEDITEVEYLAEDFETQTAYDPILGWTSKDLQGDLNWLARSYSGNLYAQISSYNSGAINEVYLISPEIDLSNAIAPEFAFDIAAGHWNATCLTVWISEDFDGTEAGVATATWVDLTSNFTMPEPASGYSTMATAGVADLTDYAGKKVYVAFKYDGDGRSALDRGDDPAKTTTYQIDNVTVSEVKVALSVPSTEKIYAAYTLNGSSWELADDGTFYALQVEDYQAMGQSYLYSAIVPEYLPRFLKNKFPYAVEGDVKVVIYKSSSNPAYSGAMQYTFNGMEWETEDFIENKTEQFLVSNDGWVFDPTVVYTMTKPDYQIIVDYVKANIDEGYIDSYGTAEFYYGFASYYGNVSFRLSYRTSYADLDTELTALTTNEEKVALLNERLKEGMEIFTQLRFPEAIPTVSGIEVFYVVTTNIYYANGINSEDDGLRAYTYKCTAAASGDTPPQFEFISAEAVK
jgi:hypothetical protein